MQLIERLLEITSHPRQQWVLTDELLVSFHDLTQEPWPQICDRESVESFDSDDFAFAVDEEQKWTFTKLLYMTLKEKLWELGVRYDKEFKYYHFMATRNLQPRKIYYQGLATRADRIVFGPYYDKKDKEQVRYYRHHAFDGQFRRFDQGWYLQITPTYRYTSDGRSIYRWYEDELRGIKRFENNQAVLGQVVMWASILSHSDQMFDPNPLLVFGGLKTFDLDAGVFDDAWLPQEEAQSDEDDPDSPFGLS